MKPRILIVFSDPGGAKPCLALASKWSESSDVLICSDREYSFFEIFDSTVTCCSGKDAGRLIQEFQPDLLYTGTSYTSNIELAFLSEGNKRGIETRAFVDHYTQFRERFTLDGRLVLPDRIDVLDDQARHYAIEAGLPAEKIHVTGNPYHSFLRSWEANLSRVELWKELGFGAPQGPVLIFAPDPLSNVGGVEAFGSDESNILRLLLEALGEIDLPVQLLIKAHPNQDLDHLSKAINDRPDGLKTECILIGGEVDSRLNDLIKLSDLVVGMFSSFLIEAELLGRPTLRILCELQLEDPLKGVSKGIEVTDKSTLSLVLRDLLKTDSD